MFSSQAVTVAVGTYVQALMLDLPFYVIRRGVNHWFWDGQNQLLEVSSGGLLPVKQTAYCPSQMQVKRTCTNAGNGSIPH